MRYRKITTHIQQLIILCLLTMPILAQTQTKVKDTGIRIWTEQEALNILERDSRSSQVDSLEELGSRIFVNDIYHDLLSSGDAAAEWKSDRIVQAIVDFPIRDAYVGQAKIAALFRFKNNSAAYGCVVHALQDMEPIIQREAARVAFLWGEWDLSVPIIKKHGDFDVLMKRKEDPRVFSALQEGARSSSWEGRTRAAYFLQDFGDSTTIVQVARDVVAHAPIDVEDNSVARAKYTALRALARFAITDNIPDIARLANDRNTLVRITVVDMLELYAYNGIGEAYQALKRIAEENADLNLRGTAKVALENLESHRREK